MDPKNRMGCKIILIFFALFWIVVFIVIYFTVNTTIGLLEEQSKDNELAEAEKNRFENLPLLKGVVLEENSILTPFSKVKVNVCFVNFGLTNSHPTHMGGYKNNRRSSTRVYETEFSKISTIYKKNSVKLLIDKKIYILNSHEIILTNIYSDQMDKGNKIGIWGETFSTNEDYDKLLFLNKYKFYKQYSKTTLQQEKDYLNKIKIFCSFRNENDHINCYYLTRFHKKDIPEKCSFATADRYHLREYIFNEGDTISFKGKIVNNKIVPLY
ncbi:hypothetical protein MCETHM1_00817 [Flavobacteriaceae bacterium]|jgi:hypothetical protein